MTRRKDRGVALIAVLWLLALLSVLAGATVMAARDQSRTATAALQALQNRTLAESAFNRTIQLLSDADPKRRPGLGTRVSMTVLGQSFTVMLADESGRKLHEVLDCLQRQAPAAMPTPPESYSGRLLDMNLKSDAGSETVHALFTVTGDLRQPILTYRWAPAGAWSLPARCRQPSVTALP